MQRPESPASRAARAFRNAGWKRWLKPTLTTRLLLRRLATIRRAIPRHCAPPASRRGHACRASTAASVTGASASLIVETMTTSTSAERPGLPVRFDLAAGIVRRQLLRAVEIHVGDGDERDFGSAATAARLWPIRPQPTIADAHFHCLPCDLPAMIRRSV